MDMQTAAILLQAVATVVLVAVTIAYVRVVNHQTKGTREAAEAARRSAHAAEISLEILLREERAREVAQLQNLRAQLGAFRRSSKKWADAAARGREGTGKVSDPNILPLERMEQLRSDLAHLGGEVQAQALEAFERARETNTWTRKLQEHQDGQDSQHEAMACGEVSRASGEAARAFDVAITAVDDRLKELEEASGSSPAAREG